MTIEQMRKHLANDTEYGAAWSQRVYKMHDNQVIAVYNKFLAEGRFNKKPKDGVQLSMFKKGEKNIGQ